MANGGGDRCSSCGATCKQWGAINGNLFHTHNWSKSSGLEMCINLRGSTQLLIKSG